MPFQDYDEETVVDVPQPPNAIERLLRRLFVEDLGLKLLALGITLFIWFAVTGENKPITIHTAVQLNFVRPSGLEVSNDPPRTVEVLLTGSKHRLNGLRLLDLVATVNLSDSSPGDRVIRLSRERVTIELPPGVTIDSFRPSTIPVRLEPISERQVPVEVRLDGKPADGFEVYGIRSSPGVVRVTGPISHLNELNRAPTETVSVEGKRESFIVSRLSIAIANQKLEALDPVIDVTIDIGEKRIEKTFDNVSARLSQETVYSRSASVTLLGVPQLLNQLQPEDIKVVVETSPNGEQIPRLELPSPYPEQIKLVSIRPSVFR